jgi:uncharacterized protein DUF3987
MKTTTIDHAEYVEKLYEPDDPPPIGNGKATNGHAAGTTAASAGHTDGWPVLDKAAYYGLAGEVVAALLPETEAAPAALLLQYLASFGNMVGRKPFVWWASVKHYPNIFVLIIGRTSRSRKGTSAQNIRVIMERTDPDWVRGNIKSGITSGEGIIEMVRDARYEMNKKTQTLVCVDPGVFDKRLLLDEREFSSSLNKMKQDANIVSQILREAWDCSPPILAKRAKYNASVSTEPLISMVAHITMDELRQKLDKLAITDGFGNRFLYSCTDRSKLLPFGGDLELVALDALATKTRLAVQAAQKLDRITMADSAKPRWEKFYRSVEEPTARTQRTAELIDHLTARAAPQVLRLAMLYALLDGSSQMMLPHVEAAIAVWQFCEASARYIFGDLSNERIADTILRELDIIRPEGLSRRDMIRGVFGGHIQAYDLSCALRKLEAAGKIRCQKQRSNGPGRPGEMWFAN